MHVIRLAYFHARHGLTRRAIVLFSTWLYVIVRHGVIWHDMT